MSDEKKPIRKGKRRWSVPIRFQLLGLITVVLVGSMVAYLLLAVSLFSKDKEAYVYDLNATLARMLGEDVEVALEALTDKLGVLATSDVEHLAERAETLFARDADVLAVTLWQAEADGRHTERGRWTPDARLGAVNLKLEQLVRAHESAPVEWGLVRARGVWLGNASLEPDVALLQVAVALPEGGGVAVADVRPERFLRLFGKTDIFRAYLVDEGGRVLVHPDAAKVIKRADLGAVQIVQAALGSQARHAVKTFAGADGGEVVGAYARIFDDRLAVVTEVPRAEALRAADDLITRSQLFAIGIILVALLASAFFARMLTAPIKRLKDAAQSVARGLYDVEVDVRSRNEVGELADAFEEMAHELNNRDQRLRESLEQLVHSEKLATVGQMSASISHEVKNPMAAMRGFAQLGLKTEDPLKMRAYLERIEEESERATDILNTLLTFARKERERWPIDVSQAVFDVTALPAHQLRKNRIRMRLDLHKDPPAVVANPIQIQQVVLNLVLNAIDAMAGGGTLDVSTYTAAEGVVVIQVTDSGSGVDKEVLPRIFEPFFTTKPEGRGTGLGLYVAKTIVEDHGGEIMVEPGEKGGTTFRVMLPSVAWEQV